MLHLTKKAIKLWQCIMNCYQHKDCLGGYLKKLYESCMNFRILFPAVLVDFLNTKVRLYVFFFYMCSSKSRKPSFNSEKNQKAQN